MGTAPKSDLFRKVGQNVSKQRFGKDLNQTRFAKQLQISRTSLALIESGKQGLTLPRLYQIAQTLGIEVSVLLPPVSDVFPTHQKTVSKKPDVPGLREESVQQLADILKKRKGSEYRDEASNNISTKTSTRSRRNKSTR